MGVDAVVAKASAVLGDGPTYVTFDVDSLDPGFAPGTGTPEVGGLTPREALAILRGCDGIDVVGGDVVEVAPQLRRDHRHRAMRRAGAVHAGGAGGRGEAAAGVRPRLHVPTFAKSPCFLICLPSLSR